MHPGAGLELHCDSHRPNHSKRRGTKCDGGHLKLANHSLKEAIWNFFFTCEKYVTGKTGNSGEFQKCE